MVIVSNNTQASAVFQICSVGTKEPKICQNKWTIKNLSHWCRAVWIHAFVFFMLNSDHPVLQQKSDQVKVFFQSSHVQFWWTCSNCSLSISMKQSDHCSLICGIIFTQKVAAHWIFSHFWAIVHEAWRGYAEIALVKANGPWGSNVLRRGTDYLVWLHPYLHSWVEIEQKLHISELISKPCNLTI